MMQHPVAAWHAIIDTCDAEALGALLADDATFHSPVVHTPQVGKALTMKYLGAALQVFLNGTFHYVREVVGERDAVLEFVAVLTIPNTNVGGYENTAWDMVSNLVGSVIAAVVIRVTTSPERAPGA